MALLSIIDPPEDLAEAVKQLDLDTKVLDAIKKYNVRMGRSEQSHLSRYEYI